MDSSLVDHLVQATGEGLFVKFIILVLSEGEEPSSDVAITTTFFCCS